MKTITLTSILFLLLFGCNNRGGNKTLSDNSIKICIDSIEPIQYSNIFKLTDIISFDTTILISKISRIKQIDDNLLIKYRSDGSRLLLKNTTTGLTKLIGERGKGPGEYLAVTDFTIDKTTSSIWLLDERTGKIVLYDINGKFKKEIKYDNLRFAQSFYIIDKTKIAVYYNTFRYGFEKYRLLFLDLETGNVLNRFFDIPENQPGYMTFIENNCFSDSGLFHYKFNRNFYKISPAGAEKIITIDFGDNNLPENLLERDYDDVRVFVEYLGKTRFAYGIYKVFDLQNSLYFNFTYKNSNVVCLYSKNSGKYKLFDRHINNVFGLGETGKTTYNSSPIGANTDTLFFLIEPFEVKTRLEKIRDSYSEIKWQAFYNENKKWVDLFDSLSINSNPLIVRVQVKGF